MAVAACVPTPFTFEETGAGGSGGSSSSVGGGGSPSGSGTGGGSTTSSTGSSSSSTGTGPNPCGEGSVCIDAVAEGWEGPKAVRVTPAGEVKPSCPDDVMPEKLSSGQPTNPHTCGACSCTIINGTCSAPEITCWTASNCQGGIFIQEKDEMAVCANGANPPVAEDQPGSCSITGGSSVVAMGTCSPSGGAIMNNDGWANDVRACPKTLTGSVPCAGGMCEPVGPGEQLCIRKAGSHTCPPGWDVKVESFGGEDDLRMCTACACNGISCSGGSYTVYEALDCNGAYASEVVNSSDCTPIPNVNGTIAWSRMPVLGSVVQNGCSGGGQPTGAFTPTDPVTFCCKN